MEDKSLDDALRDLEMHGFFDVRWREDPEKRASKEAVLRHIRAGERKEPCK